MSVNQIRPTLEEVAQERLRQVDKWGHQNHPDGTGGHVRRVEADVARELCDVAHRRGAGTWLHILEEEVREAFAESDPALLRTELVQVAAVACAWVEAIDRRLTEPSPTPETCAFVVFAGSRYGATPEPPEYCDEDVVEGSEFCAAHQADFE